jgi:hypothetical protein
LVRRKYPAGNLIKLRSTIYNNEVRGKIARPKRGLRKSEVYNAEAVVKCTKKQ